MYSLSPDSMVPVLVYAHIFWIFPKNLVLLEYSQITLIQIMLPLMDILFKGVDFYPRDSCNLTPFHEILDLRNSCKEFVYIINFYTPWSMFLALFVSSYRSLNQNGRSQYS